MRAIARFLRKLADLFDPRIAPSEHNAITVMIRADTEQFEQSMNDAKRHIEEVDRLIQNLEKRYTTE